jgi:pseudouridine-5'-phosphate glycosidase
VVRIKQIAALHVVYLLNASYRISVPTENQTRTAHIAVSDDVKRARQAGQPIVALESSVLAQGLPIPANAEAHRRMVSAVKAAGAVSAITAVVHGVPTVGLEGDALQRFLGRTGVRKVSARDLPIAMAGREDGATTVAASLVLCRAAEIGVFATGGIGGVHRAPPFDESADLLELSRSPVAVVCAGAKSILDLPATLERLESYGVTVVGFGTDRFPGFLVAETDLPVGARVDRVEELAEIVGAARALRQHSAVLVVRPVPAAAALDAAAVRRAVETALHEAEADGIRGASVTPFLLAAVERATGGASLGANLALLEANAALAGALAVALTSPTHY